MLIFDKFDDRQPTLQQSIAESIYNIIVYNTSLPQSDTYSITLWEHTTSRLLKLHDPRLDSVALTVSKLINGQADILVQANVDDHELNFRITV